MFFSDNNWSESPETQNNIVWNWRFNLIAIQSKVTKAGDTLTVGVVHGVDRDWTNIGTINTCE